MEILGYSESTMILYYARSNKEKRKQAINNSIINGEEKHPEKELKKHIKQALFPKVFLK